MKTTSFAGIIILILPTLIASEIIMGMPNMDFIFAQPKIGKNDGATDPIQCYVIPCDKSSPAGISDQQPINATSNSNATAIVGISIPKYDSSTVKDLQNNKDQIKTMAGSYLNKTVDKLSTGAILQGTYCLHYPKTRDCPMIMGIIVLQPPK
jgi:hypothetical protein